MSKHSAAQGYLTFAKNTDSVDYLQLAYVQALCIKDTQKINQYAVVVDTQTGTGITEKHKKVFDYIIVQDSLGPFDAEPLVFELTPFKETIKLESDLLFTQSIDHWWPGFRLKDVGLSLGCRDYLGTLSNVRTYRQFFDDNNLPDVYNGLMYFRYSQTAYTFFKLAQEIFNNWDTVKLHLTGGAQLLPSTDVVYALAALVLGPENCTMPSLDYINFVHMKPAINNVNDIFNWSDIYRTEFDNGMIRINNINQYHPFHYFEKTFLTQEMIDYYERNYQ